MSQDAGCSEQIVVFGSMYAAAQPASISYARTSRSGFEPGGSSCSGSESSGWSSTSGSTSATKRRRRRPSRVQAGVCSRVTGPIRPTRSTSILPQVALIVGIGLGAEEFRGADAFCRPWPLACANSCQGRDRFSTERPQLCTARRTVSLSEHGPHPRTLRPGRQPDRRW